MLSRLRHCDTLRTLGAVARYPGGALVALLLFGACDDSRFARTPHARKGMRSSAPDSFRPRVVLYLPVSECFSCYGSLPRWRALEREGRVVVDLVVDAEPSPAQEASIRQQRTGPYRVADPLVDSIRAPEQLFLSGQPVPSRVWMGNNAGSLLALVSDSIKWYRTIDSLKGRIR